MLSYYFEDNIPLFSCSLCGKCDGFIESTSLIHIKNRGCCWYFPKYTLMDLKNIISIERVDFIHELKENEKTVISNYHLEVKGYFDEEGYNNYGVKTIEDFDTKLFFRLCPFSTEKGCSIDFKLRPHPCNLYLCRQVIDYCGDEYRMFSKERKDYYSYMNYYNELLKRELIDKKIDLIKDFDRTIEFISKYEVPKFEPRKLNSLSFARRAG
ncbi:hypothetical protein [Thermobrachium celere]|uniref:hypothetical protein n=1 Tax=Thermobrachium celere TaxID=53422 RepID=UPI001941196A|nr:hypothetical protein [Thermobrachium celere]GFR36445.1 hypothetical protein TCEA9_22570 [Thermobrachium celere]